MHEDKHIISQAICRKLSLSSWDQIYPRCVISASCTYEFPISVADTYTLFLLRLYIIRILDVVAQATLASVDKNLLSTAHSRRQASYVFARDINLSFLPKLNSRATGQWTSSCLHRAFLFLSRSSLPLERSLRSFPPSLCLSSVTHRRLWTASRTRAN